jgi:hypothetical protein
MVTYLPKQKHFWKCLEGVKSLDLSSKKRADYLHPRLAHVILLHLNNMNMYQECMACLNSINQFMNITQYFH